MVTYGNLVIVYVVGGLTFVPLCLVLLFVHAYLTQPIVDTDNSVTANDADHKNADDQSHGSWQGTETFNGRDAAKQELAGLPPGVSPRSHEPDVAAGYFAVCREFVPGGVNGKPPERTGAVARSEMTTESPSVYQSMYRSIFERGKTQSPSIDGAKGSKKTRNVFFVVLRLGHLMLYDDSEQLEVRHVISLSHYNIDVYAGGEEIPEGELWVKRNCIRLSRKPGDDAIPSDTKPFFLFCNNCSEKEDFYHALLQNARRNGGDSPSPLLFEHEHMIKLIRQLHATEDNVQTRWINALIGRMFLSVYKTSLVEDFVRKKITKKLSRVVKPAFISSIQIRKIYLGDGAPIITNPRLKELTIPGDLTLEADLRYKGKARIDIAAVARIDLGPRFKAREVEVLLAVICKSIEGHVMFRVKPPPSNRIWFSFEKMPKLDMSIEPVVSSRQITYNLVLRAIESRIREVIGDTLVYPNWDDAPFSDTLHLLYRGGIWNEDPAAEVGSRLSTAPTLVDGGEEIAMQEDESPGESVERVIAEQPIEVLAESPTPALFKRKSSRSSSTTERQDGGSVSTSSDVIPPGTPKGLRSRSFATAASPILTRDPTLTEALKDLSRQNHQDAASSMKDISSRSQPLTPVESPVGSPPATTSFKRPGQRSMSSTSGPSPDDAKSVTPKHSPSRAPTSHSTEATETPPGDSDTVSTLSEVSSLNHKARQAPPNQKQKAIASTAAAAKAAKKWGLDFVSRHSPSASVSSIQSVQSGGDADTDSPATPPSSTLWSNSLKKQSSKESVGVGPASVVPRKQLSKESIGAGLGGSPVTSAPTSTKTFGRGQPLPPPGQPLPGPPKPNRMTWTAPLGILTRKKADSVSTSTSSSPKLPSASDDVGQNKPIEIESSLRDENMDSPQAPPLPQRPKDGSRSTSMEDLLKGSSIPRRVSRQGTNSSSRRRKPVGNGAMKTGSPNPGEEDSVLVIKAPEDDHDAVSIASSVNEDGDVAIAESDAMRTPSPVNEEGSQAILDCTSSPIEEGEAQGNIVTSWSTPAFDEPKSLTARSTTSPAAAAAADDPLSNNSLGIMSRPELRVRRSRTSLIPTPSRGSSTSPIDKAAAAAGLASPTRENDERRRNAGPRTPSSMSGGLPRSVSSVLDDGRE